jgi:hypothetical protein
MATLMLEKIEKNPIPLITLGATAVSIWTLKKLFQPVHISKDECIDKVATLFPIKYESGKWSELKSDFQNNQLKISTECTDTLKGTGLYYWKVPTSIFFGLNPTTLGKASTYNEKKQRQELTVEVTNPAESRKQKETLKLDAITGVVLRGNGVFGWTSQPVDTSKFPSSLYMMKTDEKNIENSSELKLLIQEKSKQLLAGKNAPNSCFNKDHCSQLQNMIEGGSDCKLIENAMNEILSFDETSKYNFHSRAFGGGPWRAAITYDFLVQECVPWYRRMFASKITIDEMWGGKILEYDDHSKFSLVGIEFRGDGKKHYIRVTIKDRSPSETYFRAAN